MTYKKIKTDLDKEYWEHKYENNKTGWDIGYISTPIKNYIDQLKNKNLKLNWIFISIGDITRKTSCEDDDDTTEAICCCSKPS